MPNRKIIRTALHRRAEHSWRKYYLGILSATEDNNFQAGSYTNEEISTTTLDKVRKTRLHNGFFVQIQIEVDERIV